MTLKNTRMLIFTSTLDFSKYDINLNSKGVDPVRDDFGLKFQVRLTKDFGQFFNN